MHARHLQKYDGNVDGWVTLEEIRERISNDCREGARVNFDKDDKNLDGGISSDEFPGAVLAVARQANPIATPLQCTAH